MAKLVNKSLIQKMFAAVKRQPVDTYVYTDLFEYLRSIEQYDFDIAHENNMKLRGKIVKAMDYKTNLAEFFELYKKTLLFEAKNDFDSYLQYLEINRKPEERFYLPRRHTLRTLVQDMQDLTDDKLDELFLSQPPRTGKTSLLMFYTTWLIGRNSEKSNLYSAYSDTITKAFYNGVLETIQDPDTYLWDDVFPEAKIVQTNAQEETLNIDRKKRYPSLTCRSLYGTLNGACDCNGVLITDDLIGGIEEALNPDRLWAAWSKVDNNLIPRAKEGAKLLWVGTRWSIIDPAGIRMSLLLDDEKFKNRRFRVRNVPALTKDDESNFEYDYGVGFSTDYYHQRRASFERNNDMASWEAQYMGRPIEREGALFEPDGMRYYNGELPGEPDRVFMAVDPAFGGGDYVASPVCFQYDEDVYIVDVVYSNEDKTITQRLLAQMVEKYGVTTMQIEANKSTESYKDGISDILKEKGIKINMTTKPAPPTKSKEQRIFDKAPDIREFMVFKESGKRPKQYDLFMQNVFSFKMLGKNKHDDAPDSLSMAMDMVRSKGRKVELFSRTF